VSNTPRTDDRTVIIDGNQWVNAPFARQLERELNAANIEIERLTNKVSQLYEGAEEQKQRIKRLEEAFGLVLKMRNDWLENQEDGYEGAYYAFVKGNDPEWEEIIKAKEDKL
jgi:hypothetical protein